MDITQKLRLPYLAAKYGTFVAVEDKIIEYCYYTTQQRMALQRTALL